MRLELNSRSEDKGYLFVVSTNSTNCESAANPNTHNFSVVGSLVSTYEGPGGFSFCFLALVPRAANRVAIGGAGPELKRGAANAPRRVKLNDPQLKLGVLLEFSHGL